MKRYRDISINSKLATIALLTCITALALACAALFIYEVQSFKRTLVRDLRAHATTLAGLSTAALTFDDTVTATEMLGELKNQRHIKWAVIFKDGKVFAQYLNPALNGLPPAQPPAAFGRGIRCGGSASERGNTRQGTARGHDLSWRGHLAVALPTLGIRADSALRLSRLIRRGALSGLAAATGDCGSRAASGHSGTAHRRTAGLFVAR